MRIYQIAGTACFAMMGIAVSAQKMPAKQKFIETANMDKSVKPGDNFYTYVNGKWEKNAVIPPTESSIGSFLDLYNRTKEKLKGILLDVSKGGQVPGSIEQKVGDFYASGMDSATIEKLGYSPIKPFLKEIDAIKDSKGITLFIAREQAENTNILYALGVSADDKNSSMNILSFSQAGLGLPDRDYYFKTDPATVAIQKAYQAYLAKLFTITGTDSVKAAKNVASIYDLEKQLATSHRTNVELRDPQSNYNKMAVTDLQKTMPVFDWKGLFAVLHVNPDSINVNQPAFYTKVNELLKSVPLSTWKEYLKASVLKEAAPALSSDFVNARFNYIKSLTGQKKIKPRWERIYRATDGNLGDALGQLYVKKYFTADAKKRMLVLVNNLSIAFENRINRLDWMSGETKTVAKEKLHAFLKKIGFPDKWRDYSAVTINRGTYFNNLVACAKNEFNYQISKVGKSVDKTEWGMTPPTINAYYNPTFNEIVFPAGILQFPFFDPAADDAINYGGIGMVIGHEMTHGFDDQGAQYNKDGNLANWWATADSVQFVAKSKKVIDLYSSFTVLDTLHINGELTTGENMADIGGIAIAYEAFKMTKQGKDTTRIDGFTPDQRFFISFAQIWRSKEKDEVLRQQVNTNPHSPANWRVLGPLMNFTPFYTAFNVQPGDKMYKPEADRIKIW
ncbi:M13 family metallopeptidase [Parasediminibacterium sp. JCM 36343]|uniref:M13 family metallopeptidase n=1 Tax=Parasediminibacterium sp. JCM 36343 TaxID=3374279 RepID=UPI00397D3D6D